MAPALDISHHHWCWLALAWHSFGWDQVTLSQAIPKDCLGAGTDQGLFPVGSWTWPPLAGKRWDSLGDGKDWARMCVLAPGLESNPCKYSVLSRDAATEDCGWEMLCWMGKHVLGDSACCGVLLLVFYKCFSIWVQLSVYIPTVLKHEFKTPNSNLCDLTPQNCPHLCRVP